MARLGDICTQITDGSHNPPVSVGESSYLMLSSKNIDDDSITLDDPRYLSKDDFDTENKRTNIEPDDLLMTIVGTIGRVAIVPNELTKICVQRSVAVLKPKSDIVYNRFLMYYLQNMRPYLEQESRGVAQKGIYLKQIGNLTISLPPLSEQRHIAAVLDKVSGLISKRCQQLDKLDLLIKARFVEMFGNPMTNPKKWPVYELSKYIRFLTSGSRGWAKYFTDEGEYFITIKNVKNCRITLDNVQYIVPPDNAEAKRTKVQEGDLLISITADLGRTGVVTKGIANYGGYINQHLTCIRLNQAYVRPLYVAYYMESDAGKEQFQSKNQSAVKAGLNFNSINTLRLIVPPIEFQDAFTAFVEHTDKSKLAIQKSLEKMEILKKALMQEYFM